jgi:Cof subfamily protein (haloacid dehalogenase superfamily)
MPFKPIEVVSKKKEPHTQPGKETEMDSSRRIHLVISDVDGTLLNPQGELSPVNYVAVARLRQAGVKFSLSSARPSFGMHWLIRMLEIDCVCSGLNGSILFHADGTVVAETELDRATVKELASRMQKHGLDVWLYTRDQWFVPRLSAPQVLHNAEALRRDPERYAKICEVSAPILKISGTSDRPADLAACEAELRRELAGRVSAMLSPPHNIDVTHPSADKGRAAVAIAITEGAQMDEVATIGDSPADTPMFQAGRLSIAMGQASEEVRRMATQVTRSNADNGLAWAIEYVLRGKWFSHGAR